MQSSRLFVACLVSALATSAGLHIASADPTCNGLAPTITATAPGLVAGTEDADVILVTGTTSGVSMGPVVVNAGAGHDLICLSSNLANVVIGGEGVDTVSYEHSVQNVVASMNTAAVRFRLPLDAPTTTPTDTSAIQIVVELWPGVDLLPQTEKLIGSPQLDVLVGNVLYADDIRGGAGDDIIIGLFGDDRLYGDADNDTLIGDGYDAVTYDPVGGWVLGPIVVPQFSTDKDLLDGGEGSDGLNDDTGNNTFTGGPGNDTFAQGYGHDSIDGGPGRDLANYAQRRATVDLRNPRSQNTGQGVDTLINVEDLRGSEYNDVLIGKMTIVASIHGGSGDDLIAGALGDRYAGNNLDGGTGNDGCYGTGKFSCEFDWTPPSPATNAVPIPDAPTPCPAPSVPTSPSPSPAPSVPAVPSPSPVPSVSAVPPCMVPSVSAVPSPSPAPTVPTAPSPSPAPSVPTAPSPSPAPSVPTAPSPSPAPTVPTAPSPSPAPSVPTS